MSDLPVNIDASYLDDGTDASVQAHQEHHDAIHALYNNLVGSGAAAGTALLQALLDGTYAALHQAINAQTGTTYTLVLGDDGKVVECANASPITLTVPPNSSVAFPIGTRIDVSQTGAGALTIAQGSGVTIKKPASLSLVLQEQESTVTLWKVATDTWRIAGDLTAA